MPPIWARPWAGAGRRRRRRRGQEDKKTELKTATNNYKAAADALYQLFTSNCDLLIGAFDNRTPKAKQITAIRKQLTKTKGSSGGSS
jgi:hypothetical protein